MLGNHHFENITVITSNWFGQESSVDSGLKGGEEQGTCVTCKLQKGKQIWQMLLTQ
jgi:hypothetical protein